VKKQVHLVVRGLVQGVGFRASTQRRATLLETSPGLSATWGTEM